MRRAGLLFGLLMVVGLPHSGGDAQPSREIETRILRGEEAGRFERAFTTMPLGARSAPPALTPPAAPGARVRLRDLAPGATAAVVVVLALFVAWRAAYRTPHWRHAPRRKR